MREGGRQRNGAGPRDSAGFRRAPPPNGERGEREREGGREREREGRAGEREGGRAGGREEGVKAPPARNREGKREGGR